MALPSEELVHEALQLAGQLQYHPGSHYAAAVAGGPQFIGWDEGRYIAAQTHDVILTFMAALGGKAISREDLYPRPVKAEEAPQEAATISEFNPGAFLRWLTS